jgi:hypothetical protein
MIAIAWGVLASISAGGDIVQIVESMEMALPGHPQILSHLEYGAPQTSNYDVCATHQVAEGQNGGFANPLN